MADIQTDRLLIRSFQPGDLLDIHRILEAAFGTSTHLDAEQSLRERESWLHWSILSQEWLPKLHQPPYGDRAVVLRSTDTVIGAVGYVPLLGPFGQIPDLNSAGAPPGRYTAEVGLYWVIDPAHQKRGFASEAARALVDQAFAEMRLKRILATTEYTNAASQAVMRRLGMHIASNPLPEPVWLQIVGILENPVGSAAGFSARLLD
ncbi:MAG TPA: GNAT family N-acetyltransferase [Anaerolineales bacterium]|nr:GNAT family N-acetyltransferase [Anaerolineales bacterium]